MKWIVDAKAFEYDKHYSDCRKENRPYIKARINRETGNYLIFLDMATCNYKLSEKPMNQINDLFITYGVFPKKQSLTSELCTFDGIKQTKLNRFLNEISEIIQLNQ